MIKKIPPCISSGVLVGRNSTLLSQTDLQLPDTLRTLLPMASRNRGVENVNILQRDRKKGPAKYAVQQSAYTISCRSPRTWWDVGVSGLAGLSRCHKGSEQGGD